MIKNIIKINFVTEYGDEGKEIAYKIEKILTDFSKEMFFELKQLDIK